MGRMPPRLSVVVAAYNSAEHLAACLEAIAAARVPDAEVVVVDDGSLDATAAIASRLADKVVVHPRNYGLVRARQTGVESSSGAVVAFIDSDVIVRPNALADILRYFDAHTDVDALSGRLAKEHRNPDLASQWKNLYVHYHLGRMPERVTFVYGSIFAVRRDRLVPFDATEFWAEDTAYGQSLVEAGRVLAFLPDLQVEHLHRYTWRQLARIDFRLSASLMRIFIEKRGAEQLGRKATGYANAPLELVVATALTPITVGAWAAAAAAPVVAPLALAASVGWLSLNAPFLIFLAREKGVWFGLESIPVTFADELVRAAGLFAGGVGAVRARIAARSRRTAPLGRELRE